MTYLWRGVWINTLVRPETFPQSIFFIVFGFIFIWLIIRKFNESLRVRSKMMTVFRIWIHNLCAWLPFKGMISKCFLHCSQENGKARSLVIHLNAKSLSQLSLDKSIFWIFLKRFFCQRHFLLKFCNPIFYFSTNRMDNTVYKTV